LKQKSVVIGRRIIDLDVRRIGLHIDPNRVEEILFNYSTHHGDFRKGDEAWCEFAWDAYKRVPRYEDKEYWYVIWRYHVHNLLHKSRN